MGPIVRCAYVEICSADMCEFIVCSDSFVGHYAPIHEKCEPLSLGGLNEYKFLNDDSL